MKKICIAAIGTRGDIVPMLALSKILADPAQITFVTSPDHIRLCRENHVACYPVGDDFSKVAGSGDIAYYRNQIREQFTAHRSVYENADVIIGGGLFYAGRTLAECFGKRYYHLFFTPQVLRSDQYAPAGVKEPFRGKAHNRLLWFKSITENNLILKSLINEQRKDLGLNPIRSVYRYFIDRPGTVIALDDRLARVPQRYQNYIPQIHTLRYEDRAPLDEALQAFLQKGGKPVLINFGSAGYTAKAFPSLLKHTIDAARSLGRRIVVISEPPTDEIGQQEDVIFCGYAPHPALLPKVEAIIHHGGIGTVCAALKCATPQIIVAQGMDQYFFAEIVDREQWGKAVYSDSWNYQAQLKDVLGETQNDRAIRESVQGISEWMNGEQYREEGMRKLRAAMPACFGENRSS